MAKINYSDYIKKLPKCVLVAEAIFSELYNDSKLVKLSKVCSTTSGGTPLRSRFEFYNGKIPWLKSGELNDNKIKSSDEFITELGLKNSSAKLHPKGTLLLAMYGATAGKTGILELDAATNQAICALFPNEDLLRKKFLYWFLRQHRYKFIEISKGGAQPNISQKVINDTLIPLPSIQLQKIIVDVLDKIEKDNLLHLEDIPLNFHNKIINVFESRDIVEKLSTELAHQLSLISQLRQAFLREAMQGALVSNETSDGKTGADLLEEIKKEKEQLIKDKKIKKGKPLPPISEEEIPYEIPDNWVWCRLGEISQIERGSSPRPKGDRKFFSKSETEFNWITISDISNFAENNFLKQTKEFLTKEGVKHSRFVNVNEFIIAVSGSTTGKCCLTGIRGYIYDGLAVVRISDRFINPNYLFTYFSNIYNHINSSKTGAAFPNINTDFLNRLHFCIPPLEIQNRIVAKLDELMQYCDALEASVKESQNYNAKLLQQVLREALEGKEEKTEALALVAEEKPYYQAPKIYTISSMTILAGHVINQLSTSNSKDLGRVKLLKMMHLVQYHCQLETPLHFHKKTAGPYTSDLENQIERKLKHHRFFEIEKEKLTDFEKVTYTFLAASSSLETIFPREFGHKANDINKLLSKFRSKNTAFCERVSTMYAVWNNRLLKKETITDELLKADFLQWDEGKKKFEKDLDGTLDWMRRNGVVPRGFGDLI